MGAEGVENEDVESPEGVLVFSYGSNMCRERLLARAPSARVLGRAVLRGHALRFHKRSNVDGSGKADARLTGRDGDRVWGVLALVSREDKEALDRVEGVGTGYRARTGVVETPDGDLRIAHFYVAQEPWIVPGLRPFEWYKELVTTGARRHGLPEPYVRALEAVASEPDPDRERRDRNLAILPDL